MESALLAVAVLSVVCFANWLKNEIDSAVRGRGQLEVGDSRGNCAEDTAAGVSPNDYDTIWCGVANR
ncbi:hypothetical protein AYM40_09805 [Paraburkholderia phytofirmans OLGA172]|uniref:Uncharacterized protein n=1 Tax=Paraburkholderia phytofirmans OLGA172 TaxID=1417228 RepID=A0A160FJT0_9BURK|nr:hypothetical protein AYM40_09805 [Paraburkholderia phytofirmans OLGA172]